MKDLRRALFILNAARMPHRFLEEFLKHDPCLLWTDGEKFWEKLEFPDGVKRRLQKIFDVRWADKEVERMNKVNARFISIQDENYPQKLREIESPPIGLYFRGNWCAEKNAVGIVGTRRASFYGKRVAEALGSALAGAGQVVVSGGAAGIDGAAHTGCADSGGRTIAVFGNGLDTVYPEKHRELFERITENGALVSEYPFGTAGEAWRFPERNRVVVGLSERVVVVEAPHKSGAMITARLALDAGREIWSVPGQITDNGARGTNSLLRDGALALTDIPEFIETICGHGKQLFLEFPNDENAASPMLSEDENRIFKILQEQGQRTLDDIGAESGFDVPKIQFCLTTLMAHGIVFSPGAGRFSAAIKVPRL